MTRGSLLLFAIMSGDGESLLGSMQAGVRGNYRQWEDDVDAPIPESTVRYWVKTGRYAEWFAGDASQSNVDHTEPAWTDHNDDDDIDDHTDDHIDDHIDYHMKDHNIDDHVDDHMDDHIDNHVDDHMDDHIDDHIDDPMDDSDIDDHVADSIAVDTDIADDIDDDKDNDIDDDKADDMDDHEADDMDDDKADDGDDDVDDDVDGDIDANMEVRSRTSLDTHCRPKTDDNSTSNVQCTDDSDGESDYESVSGESLYEEALDECDGAAHGINLDEKSDVTDESNDDANDYLDEYSHLVENGSATEEEPDPKRMKLYNSARINQVQSELLHLAKALRFNESDKSLEYSLKMTNRHLPYDLYQSKYMYVQSIPKPNVIEYYFCVECEIFIEFGDHLEVECSGCDVLYKKKVLKATGQYFLYVSLEEQLAHILQSDTSQHVRKGCEESDIVNADVYKNMKDMGIIGEDDLTITAETDGVTPFNHTQAKLWPLLVTINELPYRIRKNNVLLIALWYWVTKPLMNLFLKPFIDELISLKKDGFKCKIFGAVEKLIRVHLLLFIADLPARALVLNMKQYNARYGCPYCLIRGKLIPVGRGRARVFCECIFVLRTAKMYLEQLREVLRTKKVVKAIKGPTQLARVPHVRMFDSTPPEYMHAELLGTVISFLEGWFNSKYHGKPFYLGHKKNEFNRRMTSIKPTHEISRPPVEIGKDWKASQMKNIAIYYSLACLHGLMDDRYYKHWFLFVYGLTICLRDKVSDDDRKRAEKAFELFVGQVVELYGEEFMRSNVHVLLHMVRFVRLYGAMWAWSAFPFESFNAVLAKMFHGTQHIDEQIFKMANRLRYLKNEAHEFNSEDCDPENTKLFLELTTKCNITHIIEHGEHLRVWGSGSKSTLSPSQKLIIQDVVTDAVEDECICYDRFIYRRRVFTSCLYTRAQVRSNHMISTNNNEIMKIMNLVCIRTKTHGEERYVVLGRRMEKLPDYLCEYEDFNSNELTFIVRESAELICCDHEAIGEKLVIIPMMDDRLCLVPIVNRAETD